MRKKFIFVLYILVFIFMACSQEHEGPLYKVSDKSHKSLSAATFESINSQIFFVGEHHDNPHHHSNQLEIIREIHEKAEKPMKIGLEMFETSYQHQLDQWVSGNLPLDDFVKVYYENWDLPWILYRDIFFYAREHEIPLIALNIPRRVVKKIARKGFASLEAEDLDELPSGITCDVTKEYETFIQRVFGWHGHKNDSFTNFCEAQVMWDTVMAINILQFHEKDRISKIVVLAGGGHAWKPGIPRQILLRKNLPMTVILPETSKLNRRNVSSKDTDYLWLLQII